MVAKNIISLFISLYSCCFQSLPQGSIGSDFSSILEIRPSVLFRVTPYMRACVRDFPVGWIRAPDASLPRGTRFGADSNDL